MSDLKETLSAINRNLPNIATYIKVILKREKLSEEAESYRARYETILRAMEEGHSLPRPISLIGDDDSGYHSTKPKGIFLPDQMPAVHQASFLLKRDDKFRWHRYWCKANSKEMKFSIFSDSNEESLLKQFPLETVTSIFSPPQTTECDKENCFILSGMMDGGTESETGTCEEIYLAAYSEADYHQWRSTLFLLTGSRESVRMSSASLLDGSQWGAPLFALDSASTSSSNFSSNRESMISTISTLPSSLRLLGHDSPPRGRSPLEQGISAGDSHTLSNKQQQPLPSPPSTTSVVPVQQDAKVEENNDNDSVGTIYENIDNLVMQFDSTMQATVQAMGQVGQHLKSSKKRKKKERTLLRQPSFFKGIKSHKSKLPAQKKAELEKGTKYSGYLYKKSTSGSWKKKWCVLRGAVLSYYKSHDDVDGREYVVLDAQMQRFKDAKKNYAFTVQLRGVPEPLCFGTDEDSAGNEWIARLESASKSKADFDWDQLQDETGMEDPVPTQYQSQTSLDSVEVSDGHYHNPQTIAGREQVPAIQVLSAEDAINSGIYSIPRSLPVFSVPGQSFVLTGDPFAQYDIPRPVSLTPDEEAIYDYPENVVDMEIYDYPPDAIPVLHEDVSMTPSDSVRNSVITLTPDFPPFEQASGSISDDWMHFPPPPSSLSFSRPSMAISTASSDEYYQSARNSVASMEGLYDHPRSHAAEALIAGVVDKPPEVPIVDVTDSSENSLEFGMCVIKGILFKRERFSWNKMFCLIRNSFLECHKVGNVQGPVLKLFLPRSNVSPDREVKRQWAFKVKHPRREGVLQFAAESEEDYQNWMKAFNAAASIEVKSVSNVEEMRITDLDMQRRWTNMEKDAVTLPHSDFSETKQTKLHVSGSTGVRRNTYSAGDEYASDTMKRRKKFAWIKSLSKKRGLPHSTLSHSHIEDDPRQISYEVEPAMNGLQKPQSMELGPLDSILTSVNAEDRSHRILTEEGIERFQGYLKVQRKGADNMWVRYWCTLEELMVSCYISKSDHTLTLSIQLKGSRIAEATSECKREFSFKIWHLESGQCLYFAAANAAEFSMWFAEVIKGAEYVVPLDAGISNSPLSAPFYHYTKERADVSASQRSSRSSNASLPSQVDIDTASIDSCTTGQSNGSSGIINHQGNIKKLSQNKWKDRYCVLKDATLYVYTNSGDKTPLTSIPLRDCKVELVNVPHEEVHQYTFRVSTTSGKLHMFSAASDQEMYAWAMALQDCSHFKPSPEETQRPEDETSPTLTKKVSKKRAKSKPKDTKVVSNIAAGKFTDPAYAGYVEIQFSSEEAWTRYWCVVDTDCLYIYQNQDSVATVRTIMLSGTEVNVGAPNQCKKSCVLSLRCPDIMMYMATVDQMELTKWFHALEKGTKVETRRCLKAEDNQKIQQTENTRHENVQHGKKGPKNVNQNSTAQVEKQEEINDMSTSYSSHDLILQQKAVVHRYEKKIRKTHRVATLTEQNLKLQQNSLLHFKGELSRLTVKLQQMASTGDGHAEKRLKQVRIKLQQIEKIIPYIGKYIMVNRQAEIQTVAILKETCTVDLHRLKHNKEGNLAPALTQRLSETSISSLESYESFCKTPEAQLETHFEEVESLPATEPPTPIAVSAQSIDEIFSLPATIGQTTTQFSASPAQNLVVTSSTKQCSLEYPQNVSETSTITTAKMTQSVSQPAILQPSDKYNLMAEPPYANLAVIRAEVEQLKNSMNQNSVTDVNPSLKEESPYATLSSVRSPNIQPGTTNEEEIHYAEVKTTTVSRTASVKSPSSNYAELDFTKIHHQAAPTSPNSRLNYVKLDFDSTKQKPVMIESPTPVVSNPTSASNSTLVKSENETSTCNESVDGSGSILEVTLIPESAVENIKTPPVSPIKTEAVSNPSTKSTAAKSSALREAAKLFEIPSSSTPIKMPHSSRSMPPPVKKKPSGKQQSAQSLSKMSSSPELTPSPTHSSNQNHGSECDNNNNKDTTESVKRMSGEHTLDAHSVTAGTMSVMERIKALQKQKT